MVNFCSVIYLVVVGLGKMLRYVIWLWVLSMVLVKVILRLWLFFVIVIVLLDRENSVECEVLVGVCLDLGIIVGSVKLLIILFVSLGVILWKFVGLYNRRMRLE